jgi:hypothetical protein
MQYLVFLGGLPLPVAPSKITTTINNRNSTVDLINDVEVNIIRNEGLTDISFTFLVPKQAYPFALYSAGFVSQAIIIEYVKNLKKAPFQFILIRGVGLPMTKTVTLEDYTITDDAEEGEDIYVDVTLKEYVPYATKKLDAATNKIQRVRP